MAWQEVEWGKGQNWIQPPVVLTGWLAACLGYTR